MPTNAPLLQLALNTGTVAHTRCNTDAAHETPANIMVSRCRGVPWLRARPMHDSALTRSEWPPNFKNVRSSPQQTNN